MLKVKESEAKLVVGKLEPPWLENTTCFPSNLICSGFFSSFHSGLCICGLSSLLSTLLSSCFYPRSLLRSSFCNNVSRCKFLSLYRSRSVVSFSFTSAGLHIYSIAVSSLFTFHLPILTLVHPLRGFFPFVCPMFCFILIQVCPNPCCSPSTGKRSFPTVLQFVHLLIFSQNRAYERWARAQTVTVLCKWNTFWEGLSVLLEMCLDPENYFCGFAES